MQRPFWIGLILLLALRFATYSSGLKDGDEVLITSRVTSEPILYDTSRRIEIKGLSAYVDRTPEVRYGDTVQVRGVVDGSKLANAKLIDVVSKGGGIFGIRERLLNFYNNSLPVPYSSLVSGIVIGSKASLPSDFWSALRNSGTAHIVVASGTNITFVAAFLIEILIHFINRRKALIVALCSIWIYVIIAGLEAPLIRAALMGSIVIFAQATGRLASTLRILLLSAAVMLLINPTWIKDVGFILSFLASGSLILIEPYVNRKLQFVPNIIRSDLSTSIAAQIGVTPVLLTVFGYVNPLSPLINVLVLWTVSPILIVSFIAGVIGVLFAPLGNMLMISVYPLTLWFVRVVYLFG